VLRFVGRQLTVIVLLNRRDIDWINLARSIAALHLQADCRVQIAYRATCA
jgi:hypothetical protein